MKQPDRFAVMVKKEYQQWLRGPQEKGWLSIADVLLRREHAAMVRAVKKMMRDQTKWESHYLEACHDILALLAQRRKGKR